MQTRRRFAIGYGSQIRTGPQHREPSGAEQVACAAERVPGRANCRRRRREFGLQCSLHDAELQLIFATALAPLESRATARSESGRKSLSRYGAPVLESRPAPKTKMRGESA